MTMLETSASGLTAEWQFKQHKSTYWRESLWTSLGIYRRVLISARHIVTLAVGGLLKFASIACFVRVKLENRK